MISDRTLTEIPAASDLLHTLTSDESRGDLPLTAGHLGGFAQEGRAHDAHETRSAHFNDNAPQKSLELRRSALFTRRQRQRRIREKDGQAGRDMLTRGSADADWVPPGPMGLLEADSGKDCTLPIRVTYFGQDINSAYMSLSS